MFHYQDVIARLRRNEGRRLIQAALRMGPRKIDEVRRLAIEMNVSFQIAPWLRAPGWG